MHCHPNRNRKFGIHHCGPREYQHVGISKAKLWRWGSKPTPGPNANVFASQWNIGLRLMYVRDLRTGVYIPGCMPTPTGYAVNQWSSTWCPTPPTHSPKEVSQNTSLMRVPVKVGKSLKNHSIFCIKENILKNLTHIL